MRRVPERFKAGITRFRPDDTAEAEAVADWWRRTFGPGWLAPERNTWLYGRNPCLDADGPGPWLCRRDGEIVGQQGEVPFELQVGGEIRRAVWAVDLHVDEAWRLRGVGPGLVATLLERNPIVCMVDLSDEGYAAFRGAGCADLGVVPVYRRPLGARALRMAGAPAVLRRGAPGVAAVLRLADGLAAASTRLAGARLVPADRLDERTDEVWAAARHAYPVLARRDLAALAWRIDQRPDRDRLRRYYLVRRGRAVGYVVLRPTVSSSEAAVVVVDYLAPPRWVAPLLLAAGRAARRDGAVALSAKTRNAKADRALRATGFVRRARDHDPQLRLLVHCTDDTDEEVSAPVHDAGAWFLTSTDSNLEHPTSDGA